MADTEFQNSANPGLKPQEESTPKVVTELDLSRTALLIIDEIGNYVGTPFEDALVPAILNTERLLQAAHAIEMPVVFLNDAHLPGLDRELELWGDHGIAGSEGAEISPQLTVAPADFVIHKRRYSGFFQTSLRLLLDELGIDTVICTGLDTNICVRHTVADAYFNNLRSIVVTDATATFLVGDQIDGLQYMKTCYDSALLDTDQVLGLLEA